MKPLWLTFVFISLCNRASVATECKSYGRFPNNLSEDCRGYTMCFGVATQFMGIDLVCPEHSIYSHLDSQCTNVTSYQCWPQYNCTEIGDFPNTLSAECTSYITCVEALGAIVAARLVECPTGMVFSRTERICVNETVFNCHNITDQPKVFEVSVKYPAESIEDFSINTAFSMRVQMKTYYLLMLFFVTISFM